MEQQLNGKQNMVDKYKYGDPKDRHFTKLAAELMGRGKELSEGRCPLCGEEVGEFRNDLSVKEFSISGMCQNCQDKTFPSSRGS